MTVSDRLSRFSSTNATTTHRCTISPTSAFVVFPNSSISKSVCLLQSESAVPRPQSWRPVYAVSESTVASDDVVSFLSTSGQLQSCGWHWPGIHESQSAADDGHGCTAGGDLYPWVCAAVATYDYGRSICSGTIYAKRIPRAGRHAVGAFVVPLSSIHVWVITLTSLGLYGRSIWNSFAFPWIIPVTVSQPPPSLQVGLAGLEDTLKLINRNNLNVELCSPSGDVIDDDSV
jgi:hypothetical protein